MRHGKMFRRRLLTLILSIAMVLTSVNVPVLTVQATESVNSENPPGGGINLPSDDGYEDNTLVVTEGEGDVNPLVDPDTAVTLEKPTGVNATYAGAAADGSVNACIQVTWGYPSEDTNSITGWEIYVAGNDNAKELVTIAPEKKMTYLPIYWDAGDYTVYIKAVGDGDSTSDFSEVSNDAKFTIPAGVVKADKVDPKKPLAPVGVVVRTIADAPTSRLLEWNTSNASNGPTPTGHKYSLDGNAAVDIHTDNNLRLDNLSVDTHTIALIPYNAVGDGVPLTLSFEVTDGTGVGSGTAADLKIPVGLELDPDTYEKGSNSSIPVSVKWNNTDFGGGATPTGWHIYLDSNAVYIADIPVAQNNWALFPDKENFNVGKHTIKLVPYIGTDKAEGPAATATLTVTGDGEDPDDGDDVTGSVLISEQIDQAFVKKAVTLDFVADTKGFSFGTLGTDYTLKINGAAVTDPKKVTIDGSKITLAADLFTTAKTYNILFAKEGYDISPVYQVVYAENSKDKWIKIWNDEFELDHLDTTKWDYQTGNGSAYSVSGWGNSEAQIYTREKNTTVGDGKLTITAKKEGDGYTSARLRTVKEEIKNGKAEVGEPLQIDTYGKVEAKIKMPTGNGIWPAFWMLPHDSEYGTWAASGEIDIMEARGRLPDEALGTIHYGGAWPNNSSVGGSYSFKEHGNEEGIDQYHIYTIEWDPTVMKWYVDGNLYFTTSNWYSRESESGNYPYPAPFDEEFYVLLNLALGGTFDSGTKEIAVDENGVNMDVDYVRWYQREGGYGDWEIAEPETEKDNSKEAQALLKTKDKEGNFIKDSNFTAMNTTPYTTDGSWIINSGYWAALLIPDNGGGAAKWSKTIKDSKNYLKVDVTNAGSQTYSSQMLQYFPVVKGYSYEISYSAYTDSNNQKADINLKIGGDGDNGWAVYSGNYTDILTTTPKTYTHKFTMTAATDPTARFEFNLATSTGAVYISDVKVKLLSGSIAEDDGEDDDKEPLSDGNHVYNGSFSNGSDSLLYWHWGTNDEAGVVSVVKDNKERKAKIDTSAGAVSLWQYGINLLQNDDYMLTFDINSDEAQTVKLAVTDKSGEVYESVDKPVNQGASKVEWNFTQPKDKTDTSSKLMLTFTKGATIDNVKLVRTTYNNVEYDNVALYPLYNGDFSNGTDGWNIWHEGAGWEEHSVNSAGQLQLDKVKVDAGGTFYCIGIQSRSMTFTRGVKYKVDFDYKLNTARTYTLELCGEQREITLEASQNGHYESEPFSGNGGGTFTLYLGPDQTSEYTFILDNVEVYTELPEKEGYMQPASIAQVERTKTEQKVVVKYEGRNKDKWEKAEKTYTLKGEDLSAEYVTFNEADDTFEIDGSFFKTEGVYSFSVSAKGYLDTQTISLKVMDKDNLLLNGTFSDGTEGWVFYTPDWKNPDGSLPGKGSFSVNEEGVAVINHEWDSGEPWHFQLYQILSQYTTDDYIVTFDAWSDVARPIKVQLRSNNSAYVGDIVYLSEQRESYTIIWKGRDGVDAGHDFNIELGTGKYLGEALNDGEHPYNIYLDNIVFRKMTQAEKDALPKPAQTIEVSKGAGKAGTDSVTVTYGGGSGSAWAQATKTVYINDKALEPSLIDDNKTNSITIDKAVFEKPGRYWIYVEADGFVATNTIYKNMIGEDGNRIFGGDMNDASPWLPTPYDHDRNSKSEIARGIFTLNYYAGSYDNNNLINWSSQLKQENISVDAVQYTLSFEASTSLEEGRNIVIEYYDKTAGDGSGHSQITKKVEKDLKVLEVPITPSETTDNFYVNFLLGAYDESLKEVPHTLQIDNVRLVPSATYTDSALKSELDALIEGCENRDQGEEDYTETSWQAYLDALAKAKEISEKSDATTAELAEAINNLKRAIEKLSPDTTEVRAELQEWLDKYEEDYLSAEDGDAFKRAYELAKDILNDPEASKNEIDAAIDALLDAYNEYSKTHHTGFWIEDIRPVTYTGSAHKPAVVVHFGSQLLKEKTDYTVTYKDNTNAGEATVTVKGKGNFSDSAEIKFTISPKDLSDEDIDAPDVYAVVAKNGTLKNPSVKVKYGKKTLSNNKDYTVLFPPDEDISKTESKTYSITIEATKNGNYTGKITRNYDVLKNGTVMVSSLKVTLDQTKVDYAGDNGKDTYQPKVTVKKGSDTLTKDKDYEIVENESYVGWNKVGKVTVTVKGKGDYYGTKTVTYTVNGMTLKANNLEISYIQSSPRYTGSPITMDYLLVKEKKADASGVQKVLVEDTHYTVGYDKNTDAGTAKLIITGIEEAGYTGTVTKNFKIDKIDLSKWQTDGNLQINFWNDEQAVYTKNGAQANVTVTYQGRALTLGTDYTVSYSDNKKAVPGQKSATIKINGKGNFKGTIKGVKGGKGSFEVVPPKPEDVPGLFRVEAADVVVPANGDASKLKASLKVYEESTNKALASNTDYVKVDTIPKTKYFVWSDSDKEWKAITPEMKLEKDNRIKVQIELKGQYVASGTVIGTGPTIEKEFRLYESNKKVSNLTVEKIPDQTYKGDNIKIEPKLEVYDKKNFPNDNDRKGKLLVEGKDYRILEYTNNTKKGTAKVTIIGIGNGYGGTKTVTFKITTKKIDTIKVVGVSSLNAAHRIADLMKSVY